MLLFCAFKWLALSTICEIQRSAITGILRRILFRFVSWIRSTFCTFILTIINICELICANHSYNQFLPIVVVVLLYTWKTYPLFIGISTFIPTYEMWRASPSTCDDLSNWQIVMTISLGYLSFSQKSAKTETGDKLAYL